MTKWMPLILPESSTCREKLNKDTGVEYYMAIEISLKKNEKYCTLNQNKSADLTINTQ